MPDKIKLTEEHKNCECNDMLKKTDVCMPEKCHIIHEDILDLFDYYKVKAEKYDFIKNSLLEPQKFDDKVTLEQENKKLKEEIERIKDKLGNELQVKYLEVESLKEKLIK